MGGNVIELQGGHVELPPLRGLVGEGWSAQVWVQPKQVAGNQTVLDLPGGGGRLLLILRGDQLVLELIQGGRRLTVGAAAKAVRAGAWTHVGASLDVAGAWALHVAGQRVADGQFVGLARAELAALLGDELRAGARLGSGADGEPLLGRLAEVRLFNRALAGTELSGGPAGRCRGDEPGLVACYRLDALAGDVLDDIGGGQAHARRVGAAQLVEAADLPLASAHEYGVRARARLVRDHLPVAVFPGDQALVPASEGAADLRVANAAGFGDVDGAFVLCSLYDTAVEVTRDGAAAGSVELRVRIDRDAWVLVEGVELALERWTAATERVVPTSPTGRVRLRVLAGEALAGPVLRLRGPDSPADVWTVVRPGDAAQASMHFLTGEELLAPSDGQRSPLAAGSDDADADALAELLTALAGALPIAAPAEDESEDEFVEFGLGKSIEKGFNKTKKKAEKAAKKAEKEANRAAEEAKKAADAARAAEEAARKGADAAARKTAEEAAAAAESARKAAEAEWNQVKHRASNFVVDSLAEATALIDRARTLPAEVGPAAIRRRLAEARKLTVATGMMGALRGTVELVGTAIVEGSEQTWRIVVAGVADVVTAVEALAARVGAAARYLVDLLADLFPWQRYLEVSDRLYDVTRRSLNDLQARTGEFTGLVEKLRDLVDRPIDDRLADRTLGELLGVKLGKSRQFDDLDRILDYAQRLLSSRDRNIDDGEPDPAPGEMASEEAAAGPAAAAGAAVPKDIFENPAALFDLPLRPMLAFPGQVYRACAPVLEPSLRAIEAALPATLRAAERTITGRLKVPVLTDLIETTILGGRSLNLLRIVCLLAAILQVSYESADRMLSFGGGDGHTADDLECAAAGFGLINSVVVLVRVVDEHKFGAKWAGTLFFINSALTATQAALGFAFAGVHGGPAQPYMIVQSFLDLALAGWLAWMGAVYSSASGPAGVEVAKLITQKPDLIVELTLGSCSIVTTTIAYGLKEANDDEFGAAVGFRFASWFCRGLQRAADGLDNDKLLAPYAAPASAGFATLNCVVELTACVYAVATRG